MWPFLQGKQIEKGLHIGSIIVRLKLSPRNEKYGIVGLEDFEKSKLYLRADFAVKKLAILFSVMKFQN